IVDRPTLPDDEFHISLSVDKLFAVKELRIYFDVDAEVNDYTRNVYYFAFSENDLNAAVQQFNATDTSTLIETTSNTAVPRTQVRRRVPYPPGQLTLGNAQWMELRWRAKDMIHVGTDPTRTLAHVKGMEIVLQVLTHDEGVPEELRLTHAIGPITVTYDSFWLSGSFGPDVGRIGDPYVYGYRYRSAVTGARTRLGPPTRAGVTPRRQQVRLQATPSPHPEVDKIDWYRRGGTLGPEWAYVGSAANATTLFLDDYPDNGLVNEPPAEDDFQPWPTQDL